MPAIRGDDNHAAAAAADRKKPLARNSACLTCRTRKVKCDAEKPACGPCVKSALLHGEDPRALQCDYSSSSSSASASGPSAGASASTSARSRSTNTNNFSSSSSSNRTNKSKVGQLEDKVARLEALISSNAGHQPTNNALSDTAPRFLQQQDEHQSGGLSRVSTSCSDESLPAATSLPWDASSSSLDNAFQHMIHSSSSHPSSAPYSAAHIDMTSTTPVSMPFAADSSFGLHTAASTANRQTEDDAFFQDLVYPGWPEDLPSPQLTRKLLDAFFSKPHMASFLLNRARFEAAFSLPPTAASFPSSALLHAILAVAYTVSAKNAFNSDRETYWKRDDESSSTPAMYHSRRAKHWVNYHVDKASKPFDLAQAVILLCVFSWMHARFHEVWMFSGMATRCCAPLGLNHLESIIMDHQQDTKPFISGPMCPSNGNGRPGSKCIILPPTSIEDRYDRASVMWHAFICDRIAQANTGWATSIDEADITTFLPRSTPGSSGPLSREDPFQYEESLSPESSSFFISHPPGIVGPFQLCIKAAVLLSRVIAFIQRAPWPIGSRAQLRRPSKRNSQSPTDLRNSAAFKDLDSDIVAFRLSCQRDLKSLFSNFTNTPDNHHLLLAQGLAHSATMFLHQPFSTRQPNDTSFPRCLTSARAIVGTVHMIMFSRFDLGLMHPFMLFVWSTAARLLVTDVALQTHRGNEEGVKRAKTEVAMLLKAMGSMNTPLAAHTKDQALMTCEHPEKLLLPETLELPSALRKEFYNTSSSAASSSSPEGYMNTEGPSLTHIASDSSEGASQRPSPHSTNGSGISPPALSDGRSTGGSGTSASTFASMSDMDLLQGLGAASAEAGGLGGAGSNSNPDVFFTGSFGEAGNDIDMTNFFNNNNSNGPSSIPPSQSFQDKEDVSMGFPSPGLFSAATPVLDFMGLQDFGSMAAFENTVIYG